MAQNQKISELSHLMEFLQKMGYDVSQLSVENVFSLKSELLETLTVAGMIRDEDKVVEAFS